MDPRFPGETMTERLGKARLQSRDITELIGLCKGVLADGVVSLQEAVFLLQWLEDHRNITDLWPASVLYASMDRMLEDGELARDEESELLRLLVEITGVPIRVEITTHLTQGKAVERNLNTSTTLPLNEPEEGLVFPERNFVLTGHFSFGTRAECESKVRGLGGFTQKGVTKKTNYVVVGEVGSESWAHSSFGRKIEKAIYLRDRGQSIFIVHEPMWRSAV